MRIICKWLLDKEEGYVELSESFKEAPRVAQLDFLADVIADLDCEYHKILSLRDGEKVKG